MRTKYIILLLTTILFLTFGILLLLPSKKITVEGIKKMKYAYMSKENDVTSYSIDCDSSCVLTISNDLNDKNVKKIKINDNTILEIENLLNRYDVGSWNNYEKVDETKKSGESFSLEIYMKNGHNVSSYGVYSFPDDFYNVKNGLDNIIELVKNGDNDEMSNINITINNKMYKLNLEDNATTKELLKRLPLRYTMDDLNNNEKYVYLDKKLPTNTYYPKTIEKGDVMLFGNNCLVIFYKSFKTNYSYTKIGHIDNLDTLDNNSIIVRMTK